METGLLQTLNLQTTAMVLAALLALLAVGYGVLRARRARIVDSGAQTPKIGPSSPTSQRAPSVAGRFLSGLSRSREALARTIARAFSGGKGADGWALAVEEALISADVGVKTANEIAGTLREQLGASPSSAQLRDALRAELLRILGGAATIATVEQAPLVVLVVGVNGSGKTTTIGKLAARYRGEGKKVVLAAGDTFRAGAIEQLKVWGERAQVPVIAHQEGADPAAVIFDGVKAGLARGADVVICDTAGRLQAQKTLMDELSKVVRVMRKAVPTAPHEVLLVLDATIGQNALSQAKVFKEVVGVTGVVLTKLDGTARGGVVLAVRQEMGLPVKLVGLGEKIEDLRDFDPAAFVDALVPEDLGAAQG